MRHTIFVSWDRNSEFFQTVIAGTKGKSRRWNPEEPLEALHEVWRGINRRYLEGQILEGPGIGRLHLFIQWRVANYFNSQRGRRSRQPRPAQIANFDFSHIESGLAQPDQIASDRELIAKIHSELAEMTPDWAEAVRSRYGFPGVPALTEIARKKGKSRQSVEKHARKGLRDFKIAIT